MFVRFTEEQMVADHFRGLVSILLQLTFIAETANYLALFQQ